MYKGYSDNMTQNRKHIVVVGGGTAGWITLSYLASTLDADFTIIHSQDIDIIGVGESTTPTIKHVAETVGVDEASWMRAGRATFKYGIEFRDFDHAGHQWFHSFDDLLPAQAFQQPMTEYGKARWPRGHNSVELFLYQRGQGRPGMDVAEYNRRHGACSLLLQQQLSPYHQDGHCNFNRYPGYAYHINAFEFGASLRSHTPPDRYQEILARVTQVVRHDHGIDHLVLEDGRKISADLYVDCTGFRRLLIGEFSEFRPYTELRNNAAVWGPVKNCQIWRPSTISTAQPHGWIWETPTQGQIGSGYTYSNDFLTEQQAIDHLTQHWRRQGQHWEPIRSVTYQSGQLEHMAWGNVVSNGLGQSFIEPLEATSIMTTCVTVMKLRELWQRHQGWTPRTSQVLNTVMSRFLNLTKEFIVGHYTLSRRQDTEYWRSYDRREALDLVNQRLHAKLSQSWAGEGETILNSFNWASMLIGYDHDYVMPLPNFTESQVADYEFVTQQMQANYAWLHRNNLTIQQRLTQIHG